MIAVLIPARNEEALIGECLRTVAVAAAHPALLGEEVLVIVALDRCTDGTAQRVAEAGAHALACSAGSVGGARAAAAEAAIERGARWLAMTDADTRVPPDWLAAQLAYACDAFCGVVQVDDWQGYDDAMPAAFVGLEQVRDGHPHVHGANMGVSAAAYRTAGGVLPLQVSEDVDFIARVAECGLRVARKPVPVVTTSARRVARARGGFADYLAALESNLSTGSRGVRIDPS